jgi:hypothetical protein
MLVFFVIHFQIRVCGVNMKRSKECLSRVAGNSSCMTDNLILVLTSTVSPARGAKVRRSDSELRREDYMNALAFWLNLQDPRLNRIVFIENSGADLSGFEALVRRNNPHNKTVEFISTGITEIPDGIHYGWGELQMLDEGLSQSRLFAQATHFVKATGRLTFPRIGRLIDRMPAGCDVLVDCRIPISEYRRGIMLIPALVQRRGAYASTQLAIFRKLTYEKYFRGIYRNMKPWTRAGSMESVIYDRLQEVAKEISVVWRFPVNCDPVGIGARNGANYQSTQKRVMSAVRGLLRPFDSIWV